MNKTTVGNLCKPCLGPLKLDVDTLIDYFDIASVDNIEKKITGYTTYTFAEAPSRARKQVKKGNILVSTVRPNLNAVALFDKETENTPVASTGFCVLECKEDTSTRFLFRYLQSKSFIRAMVSQATGASYPAVSDKIVRDAQIPVHSYGEQIQIANVLDAAAKIISKRKQQLQKLDDLVKAQFVEMFGTLHNNENGFDVVTIEDVCSLIKDGTHQTPQYTDDKETGYKFLSSKDVMSQKIDWTDIKYIPAELHEKLYATIKPQRNDILMSKNGVNYGVAAVNDTDEVFDIYVSLALLRPKELIAPVFFRCVINNPETKKQFDSSIKGIGVPNLHLGEIKKTKIFLPPMEPQKEFVSFVEQIDRSKAVIQKALDEAQLLFDSLMQKYFE